MERTLADMNTPAPGLRCIRADFDDTSLVVYQAFDRRIAEAALAHQKLVAPFVYDRMTWIKPSFLWLMYRSEWATRAGMERILKIRILRPAWDRALTSAVLTTPDPAVYDDTRAWRKQLERAPVRVQWDPERDIQQRRRVHKSIQVGITASLAREYATRWIVTIEDVSPLAHELGRLVRSGRFATAASQCPPESPYPTTPAMAKALGVTTGCA